MRCINCSDEGVRLLLLSKNLSKNFMTTSLLLCERKIMCVVSAVIRKVIALKPRDEGRVACMAGFFLACGLCRVRTGLYFVFPSHLEPGRNTVSFLAVEVHYMSFVSEAISTDVMR